jgi:RNA polymerase sigma-70 factor (ECF subfamily)
MLAVLLLPLTVSPSPSAPAAAALPDELAALRPLVRAVVASALRAAPTHADVEDAVAETMRRALEGSTRLRDGEPLRPWVLGIAKHVAMDVHRARARVATVRADDSTGDLAERIPDSAPSAFDRMALAQDRARLDAALKELPGGMREALLLFHADGKSYAEIATRMKIPVGTVATWILRARRALAEALAEESS